MPPTHGDLVDQIEWSLKDAKNQVLSAEGDKDFKVARREALRAVDLIEEWLNRPDDMR